MTVTVTIYSGSAVLNDTTSYKCTDYKLVSKVDSNDVYNVNTLGSVNNIIYQFASNVDKVFDFISVNFTGNSKIFKTKCYAVYSNSSKIKIYATIQTGRINKNLYQTYITKSTQESNTIYSFYDIKNKSYGTVTYNSDKNSFTADNDIDEITNYQNLLLITAFGIGHNFIKPKNNNYSIVIAMYEMAASVINYA